MLERQDKTELPVFEVKSSAANFESISNSLVEHVGSIAETCGASAIILYVDAVQLDRFAKLAELADKLILVAKSAEERKLADACRCHCISVPNVSLTKSGQARIAIFHALSRQIVRRGDVVICLTGLPATGRLDTLLITEAGREFALTSSSQTSEVLPDDVHPDVLERVVDLALEIGHEGREGKPVGALFVVGDTERVKSLSRQLILNPFQGHPESERNISDPALEETVKELSTIDGAFLIRGDGVIETSGSYLKTASTDGQRVPRGLGSRHHAAAGITAVTESFAVAVSQSTGTVTIFRGGRLITAIDRPRRPIPNHDDDSTVESTS